MKIVSKDANVDVEGVTEELTFGAENLGFIFEILRSKLYSDPIKAICREVTCNARDAHREAGKADKPIEIIFPSAISPELRIIDYGPGISPDRMANVFLQYGASTKRDSNTQTGGFGLGAKTPFAYSDQFSIKTTVDGFAYMYTAYIDESRVGKIALLSKTTSTKSNGTEIIISIKPSDFESVKKEILTATYWWTPRPIISEGNWDESILTPIASNAGAEIYVSERNHSWGYGYRNSNTTSIGRVGVILVLIDRMPFTLSSDVTDKLYRTYRQALMKRMYMGHYMQEEMNGPEYSIGMGGDSFYHRSVMGPPIFMMDPPIFVLPFKNGDLNVSVNREQINYSDDNVIELKRRIHDASETYINELKSDNSKLNSMMNKFRGHRF